MFKINEIELNNIIHDIIRIVYILKAVENGNLSEGQKQIIHGCETRLVEIREEILKNIENNSNHREET